MDDLTEGGLTDSGPTDSELADIGLVGLGVMGANLALNLAEKGFRVAVFDRDPERRAALASGAFGARFTACENEGALLAAVRPPRPTLLLVPAGAPTDAAIAGLADLAEPGDLVIDAGNADFNDTRRRAHELEARSLTFLGVGVSGGAEGARHGPAMMAGGSRAIWARVEPMFTAIAARHGEAPCAAWLGPDGAGHFVKTVHNGIEYADMQMIAEVYGLLRDGLGADEARVADLFRAWSEGPLASYLVEITAEVAAAIDPESGKPVLQIIADSAGQKGTGRWSAIEALRLGSVASTIEAAVGARNLSAASELRASLASPSAAKIDLTPEQLHDALHAGKIVAYAQGFDVLARASVEYGWSLDLAQVARVWRAGCIIRSAMLDDIAAAFEAHPGASLLSAPAFRARLDPLLPALRATVAASALSGLPAPALANALAYRDQLTQPRGTANILQGLRDYFGQHGFERTDRDGSGFHGPWVSG
ncbi:MAG: NADP-dependent phosphogluconate dehydrogenase [Pseudomonadota bacterium]